MECFFYFIALSLAGRKHFLDCIKRKKEMKSSFMK